MSKSQTLRDLVTERLTAAAEEIFVLFERTIAEYEEELRSSRNENQMNLRHLEELKPRVLLSRPGTEAHLPSKSPGTGLSDGMTKIEEIKEVMKEEPEEQLPMSSELQGQTEHRAETLKVRKEDEEDTDHSSDWEPPTGSIDRMRKEEVDNQVQIRDASTATQNSSLSPVPGTSSAVNDGDVSAADGAESKKNRGQRLKKKEKLQMHSQVHSGEKPYTCTLCDKRFAYIFRLNRHMRTHTGEKHYSCSHCNKTFTKTSALNRHMKTHTGVKPYSCSHCNKGFSQTSDLNRHIKTHTGEKPYSCSHCNKRFSQTSDLNRHVRTHRGEKPYGCSHCDRRYSRRAHLFHHMRTHVGAKLHICSLCDKMFKKNSYLLKHMRTHTGEKPLSCSHCNKRFILKYDLIRHIRTHTGEKPYSCSQCNIRFSRRSNLSRHMRVHTGEKLSASHFVIKGLTTALASINM